MMVSELMSHSVQFCRPNDTVSQAAHAMWDYDIGSLPVLDEKMRPIAMVTDRDICMAAFTRGLPLHDIRVAEAMSTTVHCCKLSDSVTAAEALMQTHQVRRLPVVDYEGRLCGLLSLNDIVLAAQSRMGRARQRLRGDVEQTLAAVSRHRSVPVGAQM